MRISDWSSDVCSSDLIAERSGVPYVDATLIASIPSDLLNDDLFYWDEIKPLDPERHASIIAASDYAKSGGFWRTDICDPRSEEHTSEIQSLMRISYAVLCLKKKNRTNQIKYQQQQEYL